MVKAVFIFNVAPEKQSDYIKATREKIKPTWESQGCQSYDVWQVEGENAFVKEMLFPDIETKDRVMGMNDPQSSSVKALWRSFVTNSSLKTYILKT